VPTEAREIETPSGLARITFARAARAHAELFLGHGAGGGIDAPDLVAIAELLPREGVDVGLVEQPYRVAKKRIASDKGALDAAFVAVVRAARSGAPLFVGGRSAGARVACRTAETVGARGVVALAFPIAPPKKPGPSRLPELARAGVPTLVVQGTRDEFGGPDALPEGPTIVPILGGDHSFRVLRSSGRAQSDVYAEVAAAVRAFVQRLSAT
jgi:predicted alpha/beta-hydrolase family hydrolase